MNIYSEPLQAHLPSQSYHMSAITPAPSYTAECISLGPIQHRNVAQIHEAGLELWVGETAVPPTSSLIRHQLNYSFSQGEEFRKVLAQQA